MPRRQNSAGRLEPPPEIKGRNARRKWRIENDPDYRDHVRRLKRESHARRMTNRGYRERKAAKAKQRYHGDPEYRERVNATAARYAKTPAARIQRKQSMRRWRESPKGQNWQRSYRKSGKAAENNRRYLETERGKAKLVKRIRRYQEHGKTTEWTRRWRLNRRSGTLEEMRLRVVWLVGIVAAAVTARMSYYGHYWRIEPKQMRRVAILAAKRADMERKQVRDWRDRLKAKPVPVFSIREAGRHYWIDHGDYQECESCGAGREPNGTFYSTDDKATIYPPWADTDKARAARTYCSPAPTEQPKHLMRVPAGFKPL